MNLDPELKSLSSYVLIRIHVHSDQLRYFWKGSVLEGHHTFMGLPTIQTCGTVFIFSLFAPSQESRILVNSDSTTRF